MLSEEFMKLNGIAAENNVAIVEGKDFIPKQFGFKDHVPNSQAFRFYYIKKDNNLKN